MGGELKWEDITPVDSTFNEYAWLDKRGKVTKQHYSTPKNSPKQSLYNKNWLQKLACIYTVEPPKKG